MTDPLVDNIVAAWRDCTPQEKQSMPTALSSALVALESVSRFTIAYD